jgi:hypothetical protein
MFKNLIARAWVAGARTSRNTNHAGELDPNPPGELEAKRHCLFR